MDSYDEHGDMKPHGGSVKNGILWIVYSKLNSKKIVYSKIDK